MSRATRRDFLKQSALAGVGFWVGTSSVTAAVRSPNEKLNFAGIGVGGKGSSDIDQCAPFGNIVAICDIDENHLNAKARRFPQAKKYTDFREMFAEMGDRIDAVTVSTPDHTHAVASITAMKLGKHVYCQKPLTHSVYEARQMREVARKYKVATQMGNQGTTLTGLRRAVEVVQAGVLGPVREAHVWTNRPIWPQAPLITSRPKDVRTPPPHVHWNLFLGPAPERPYAVFPNEAKFGRFRNRSAYHPFTWRGWWDFGTGALGDMACHTANMAFMALKLSYPTSVVAEAGDVNPETCPSWATVTWEFPARDGMPPVKLYWYEGRRNGQKNLPPRKLFYGENPPGSGSLLVGEKGVLYSPNDYGAATRFLGPIAKELERAAAKVPESLPRNNRGDGGMKEEWVKAIRSANPQTALSNFDYAGLLTETVLLGNVAIRTGKKIDWDGPHLRPTNCPEAEKFIRTTYREGWTL